MPACIAPLIFSLLSPFNFTNVCNQVFAKSPLIHNSPFAEARYASKIAFITRFFRTRGAMKRRPNQPEKADNSTLAAFLNSLRKEKRSEHTIDAYAADIHQLIAFLKPDGQESSELPLSEVSPSTIESYLNHLARSAVQVPTIKRKLAAIRKYFDFLRRTKLVETNPAETLAVASVHYDVLPREKILQIFQYCHKRRSISHNEEAFRYLREELILLFLLFLGVRQYQLPLLKLSRIQTIDGAATLKLSDSTSFQISPMIARKMRIYLTQRRSSLDPIFLEPSSRKPLTQPSITSLMIELSVALQVRCTPTVFHHTYLDLALRPEDTTRLLQDIEDLSGDHANVR